MCRTAKHSINYISEHSHVRGMEPRTLSADAECLSNDVSLTRFYFHTVTIPNPCVDDDG
jgi:hypothetical protein